MRCHYHTEPDGKKYFIPGCMGGVHEGKKGCHCKPNEPDRISELERRIERLEKLITNQD